ncbi:MAG: hypothetical protein ACFFDK_19910 [Promethearchaeota archaeon]
MLINLREVCLIGVFYSIIIGYQLSAYFILQYQRYRKESLSYNKTLRIFGLTTGIVITAYAFQAVREFYIIGQYLNELLIRISITIMLIGISYFLFSISSKPFSEIVNPIPIKIILVYIILTLLILPFINIISFEFLFLVSIAFLSSFYVIYFLMKLIKLSTGNVKKSLILFTIGLFFALSGIIVYNPFLHNHPETISNHLFSILMILTGISIDFIGIYNFPAFLEFHWKDNLQKLYIFEKEKFRILYSLNFMTLEGSTNSPIEVNSQITKSSEELFPRGIIGIEQITTHILNSKEEKIKKIKQGDSFILLEYGDPPLSNITYGLLVKKDMYSLRYFLKEIKKKFQSKYKYLLSNLELVEGNEEKFFLNFTNNINTILK